MQYSLYIGLSYGFGLSLFVGYALWVYRQEAAVKIKIKSKIKTLENILVVE